MLEGTRKIALDLYEQVQTPADMRTMLAGDLFFLLLRGMGRTDMDRDFLYERCREVQAAPDGYLDLWAREHYKSTIITIGMTIQDILNDPDITVGIFSHTRPIAKSFLKQIKREFECNALLQEHFPHVRPPDRRERRTWSEDEGLIVQRRTNPKEATLEAWGLVDGQPTGKHFSLLVYDDVVTRESVHSPEMIKKTTEAWELSLNLGTRAGRRRMIGTRYHLYDSYREIMERGAAAPRLYPATRDGMTEGEPAFLDRGELDRKRRDMGPYTFGCQMLLNPVADRTQGFREEWLRFWQAENWNGMNRYILADPAGEKKKDSDYTVFWVAGLGEDGIYYVIDGVRDRLNLTQRARSLMTLHRRYRPLAVGYERYGMQADIEHIVFLQERENYRFAITELGGAMPKNDRIRRLVPVFEQGRLRLPGRLPFRDAEGVNRDMTREFVSEEYLAFPVSLHDDMLDCLARILDPELGAYFPMPPAADSDKPREERYDPRDC
jgi:phage terminase large subunit-like protein